MSHRLSNSLGGHEPDFSHKIRDWEALSGRPGHDSRLISDITLKAKQTIRDIGLDQDDTTPKELYYALLEKARRDNVVLSTHLGVNNHDTPEQAIRALVSWVESKSPERDLWTIRPSVIKSYLKKQPPKQLMKALGLRSVDSMLKRNDPSDLIALASIVEKPEWLDKLYLQYKRLKPKDFQLTPAKIHLVEQEKMEKLRGNGLRTTQIITPCYETGIIVVLLPEERFSCDMLTITATLLEALGDMRRISAYFRLLGTEPDFGKKVAQVCTDGLGNASIDHRNFHWNHIHQYLVGNAEFMALNEQPHFTRQDLNITKTTDLLSQHDPLFKFWVDKEYVVLAEPGHVPVSLHLADVSVNASNNRDYEDAHIIYGQNRLRDELWARYLSHDVIGDDVVGSFFNREEL